jgi:alpha-beta hydrolase superfamily lysophospholipase
MPNPTLTTTDGLSLVGRRWLTPGRPEAAVVIVHGFSATSECPNVSELAAALHADGFDVVTYDARGHGGSGGESTLGDHEEHDVAAAVALARERTRRVVVVGASMGGIAALRYAVADPEIGGAVVVSCPAAWRLPRSVRGVLGAVMTRTSAGRKLTARLCGVRIARHWTNPLPPVVLATRVNVPIAYVHGRNDRFISYHDAEILAAATPEPSRLTLVPGMGHAFETSAVAPIRESVAWILDRKTLPTVVGVVGA